MSLIEDIAALGVDVEDAMGRFMDNSALYERMLRKLPKLIEEVPVMEFIESEDFDTALSNAHAIKGVVGNLSIVPLHEKYTQIMEYFRDGDFAKAREVLEETLTLQQQIVDCINKYN
ncbi:MAG: hypothetical protein J1F09_04970 [Oscillospiraceae bacterium]|nr:hypothetical protein [Oscillospiraceae bacterium]